MIFLQRLTTITNVIPLIAQSDAQSPEDLEILRRSIDTLQCAEIRFFAFNSQNTTVPYTVCSTPADDNDIMDASTLMSPDYVQPLIASELVTLVQNVFDPDNISCLRHLAAKKLIQTQGSQIFAKPLAFPISTSGLPDAFQPTSTMSLASSSDTSRALITYSNSISPYAKARISDHTQHQEKLAQIRLAKWAGDLQRSLQNEKARYEAVSRGERAVWLTERLDEAVNDGVLVRTNSTAAVSSDVGSLPKMVEVGRIAGHRDLLDAGDPLGLLRWKEALKRRGWLAFQVVGSFGILGAVAVWVGRTWSSGCDGYSRTWELFGYRLCF